MQDRRDSAHMTQRSTNLNPPRRQTALAPTGHVPKRARTCGWQGKEGRLDVVRERLRVCAQLCSAPRPPSTTKREQRIARHGWQGFCGHLKEACLQHATSAELTIGIKGFLRGLQPHPATNDRQLHLTSPSDEVPGASAAPTLRASSRGHGNHMTVV